MKSETTGRVAAGRILMGFTAAAAIMICGVYASAAPGDAIPYPTDYRKWVHVKSTVIGPESSSFERNGGIHHFYANEKAMEGYASGKFPDGSVLIDDLVEAKQEKGVTTAGTRKRVAVMMKQSDQFRETGGWGFEIFPGDTQSGSLTAEAKAACFACHQKGRDSVFSEFRK